MDPVSIFEKVRDIPYKIPLSLTDEDNCCSGKSDKLFRLLANKGYKVRYRVCVFSWRQLPIPKNVLAAPHTDKCTHEWVELYLDNRWVILNATWDKKLAPIFTINRWNGKSNTKTAVKPTKIFTPEESLRIVNNDATTAAMKADLEKNGKFYKAFNNWLKQVRKTR